MTKNYFIMIGFLVSIPQMALADDYGVKDKLSYDDYKYKDQKKLAELDDKKTWRGEAELGFYQMTGNTDNQNLLGRFEGSYAKQNWRHKLNLDAIHTKNDDKLAAEAYRLIFQSNYHLSDKHYLFNRIKYEDDNFSNFDYESSIAAGYGLSIFNTKITTLSFDIGLGIRRSETKHTNDITEEPIGVGQINYSRKIGSHSTFSQDFMIDVGKEYTSSESFTALKVNITDTIAMNLSYLVKHKNNVTDTKEEVDAITAVTLVYDF
jgi:putative salt-induced outer membrane protein